MDTWIDIPLEFVDLPDDFVIRKGMGNRIQIRVRGASGIIRGIDTHHLAYKANLSSLRVGTNTILLKQENIPLSTSVEVMEISPPRLELEVDRVVSRTFPVAVSWQGELPTGMELKEISVQPEEISLTGASTVLSGMKEVATKEIEIPEGVGRTWQKTVGLDIPDELETEVTDVTAYFRLGPKTRILWVKRPVTVIEPEDYDISIAPTFVRLKLDIPLLLMRQEGWRETIDPKIGTGPLPARGTHQLTYKISLPDDTVLLKAKPVKLDVTLTPKKSKELE
ncbi:CdaR family protein [Desulfoplanes sp.]